MGENRSMDACKMVHASKPMCAAGFLGRRVQSHVKDAERFKHVYERIARDWKKMDTREHGVSVEIRSLK